MTWFALKGAWSLQLVVVSDPGATVDCDTIIIMREYGAVVLRHVRAWVPWVLVVRPATVCGYSYRHSHRRV